MKKKRLLVVMLMSVMMTGVVSGCESTSETVAEETMTEKNMTEEKLPDDDMFETKAEDETDEKKAEKIDYKALLIDAVNEICENATNASGLIFKLDVAGDEPILYVTSYSDDMVDTYTYNGVKYECAEQHIDYNRRQGYFTADEVIDYVISYYDSDNIPDYVWAFAYERYLSDFQYFDEYTYHMEYINADNIPEVVCFSKKNDNIRILTWYRGTVINNTLGVGGRLHCSQEDIFCLESLYGEYNLYSLTEGKVVLEHSGKIEKTSTGDIKAYEWDGTYLSTESEFDEKLNQCFDFSTATITDAYDTTDKDTICSDLSYLDKKLDVPKWKEDYLKYIIINFSGYSDDYGYNIIDTDGNGVPELYSSKYIFTHYNDEVTEISLGDEASLEYIEGENKYYCFSGERGEYREKVFHIEEGKAVYDFNGVFIMETMETNIYIIDGVEISDEQYHMLLEKAFDSSKAERVAKPYDKNTLLSILSSAY